MENAALVHDDIAKRMPELEKDARYLLTCAEKHIAQTLDLEDEATRKKYKERHKALRRELRGNLLFAMKYDRFTPRGRLELALVATGLFPMAVHTGRLIKKLIKKS